jgi:hypothetical protein
MSQQPEPPTEGDEEFEKKVEQRMADKPDADPDEDPTDVAQEEHKSEVPALEEDEDSVVNPGAS